MRAAHPVKGKDNKKSSLPSATEFFPLVLDRSVLQGDYIAEREGLENFFMLPCEACCKKILLLSTAMFAHW